MFEMFRESKGCVKRRTKACCEGWKNDIKNRPSNRCWKERSHGSDSDGSEDEIQCKGVRHKKYRSPKNYYDSNSDSNSDSCSDEEYKCSTRRKKKSAAGRRKQKGRVPACCAEKTKSGAGDECSPWMGDVERKLEAMFLREKPASLPSTIPAASVSDLLALLPWPLKEPLQRGFDTPSISAASSAEISHEGPPGGPPVVSSSASPSADPPPLGLPSILDDAAVTANAQLF